MRKIELLPNDKDKTLSQFSGKEYSIIKSLYRTYEGVNGNNEYLATAFVVYQKLYPHIKVLSEKRILDIIAESTSIAYTAAIKAYEHMANYKPELDDNPSLLTNK